MSTEESAVDVDRLREEIESKYREVADEPTADHHFHTGRRALDHLGYPQELVEGLPDEAVEAFAGVAPLFHWGVPEAGERVVDVGSGAATDCLVAGRAVGPAGAVVGVDMNRQMLTRSRKAAYQAGLDHVEFGPAIDTFEGASSEANARTFGTFGYPIRAVKPGGEG